MKEPVLGPTEKPHTPEPVAPARPFSSSSNQRTHGDTLSARRRAVRIFCSEEPTNSLKIRPRSSRSRGKCHWLATALAMEQSEDWLTGHRYLNMACLEEQPLPVESPHIVTELAVTP